MTVNRVAFTVRLPEDLVGLIEHRAGLLLHSRNQQIEYLLTEALKKYLQPLPIGEAINTPDQSAD